MRTLFGQVLLALAALFLALELMALADPGQMALANDDDLYAPPAPWYVHAVWFPVIGITTWASVRLLNAGILGRLVRGRGLTPERVRQ